MKFIYFKNSGATNAKHLSLPYANLNIYLSEMFLASFHNIFSYSAVFIYFIHVERTMYLFLLR